jgi:hypothetical protein
LDLVLRGRSRHRAPLVSAVKGRPHEASQPILSKTEDRGDDGQISPHIRELLRGLHQERVERYEAGLEAGRVIE